MEKPKDYFNTGILPPKSGIQETLKKGMATQYLAHSQRVVWPSQGSSFKLDETQNPIQSNSRGELWTGHRWGVQLHGPSAVTME